MQTLQPAAPVSYIHIIPHGIPEMGYGYMVLTAQGFHGIPEMGYGYMVLTAQGFHGIPEMGYGYMVLTA